LFKRGKEAEHAVGAREGKSPRVRGGLKGKADLTSFHRGGKSGSSRNRERKGNKGKRGVQGGKSPLIKEKEALRIAPSGGEKDSMNAEDRKKRKKNRILKKEKLLTHRAMPFLVGI